MAPPVPASSAPPGTPTETHKDADWDGPADVKAAFGSTVDFVADLLALLVEAYEEQHHPIGPPHPVEMIRHRMRTAGYTPQSDLADLLGSRARASEVFQKKRPV